MCIAQPPTPGATPQAAQAPAPARPEDADVTTRVARDEEAKQARLRKGGQSTILTSPLGEEEQANVRGRTLLAGGR